MMSTQKSGFWIPPSYPHAVDMKYTSLSWNGEYNDLDLKPKFYYMIVIYLTLYY